MDFREDSTKPDWDDWQLAQEMVHLRGLAAYPSTRDHVPGWIREAFTADEARRADAYLAASVHDTTRLTAIQARILIGDDSGDTRWLADQLARAWAHLDELRDRIDDSVALMHQGYVAEAIGYVKWSRKDGIRSPAPASV
ncbi:hypothetical protein, partial [Actinacidiphila glaucinigra]|uniref:hypothetical protein n=1 Tax=Actinacidiphila glaucinigra TaxID=235986 RepID=UPI0035D7D22D